jgi:Flp pilus assembly pilin Flp
MKSLLHRFVQDEAAGAALEYSLVASLVSVAIAAAVITIGPSLNAILQNLSADF